MASRIHGLQDHCGSGLARDDIATVYLPDRVVCIAGKPAPTDYAWPAEFTACSIIVGAGLLAMISLRCTCQTASPASQASQLPQVLHCQQNLRFDRIFCGSGLARDGIPAVCRPDRVARIAGKPAPTCDALPAEPAVWQDLLWERACSRWHPCGVPARPRRQHRRQASIAGKPAPTDFALSAEPAVWQDLLWERACSRWHRCGVPARPRRQHRR